MMESLISVIIPVYNVEEYIRQCLDSVVNQTYKNLEIILVDDGSTDSSGKICDEYALKDSRIKVIHKKNGGLSDARNSGLDVCNGDYIGFVDSDDWVSKRLFEYAYNAIVSEMADMCFFHSVIAYDNMIREYEYNEYLVLDKKNDMIELMFDGRGQTIAAYLKLYHKKIFKNIRFPVGKTNEDAFIILDVIDATKKLVMIPESLYYYRQRNGSITRAKKWNANIFDTVQAYKHNREMIMMHHKEMEVFAEKRLFWAYRISLALAAGVVDYKEHEKEIQAIRREFKKQWKFILLNKKMSVKNIIDSYLAFLLPPRVYSNIRALYLNE